MSLWYVLLPCISDDVYMLKRNRFSIRWRFPSQKILTLRFGTSTIDRRYIFKWLDFHCHVSLQWCTYLIFEMADDGSFEENSIAAWLEINIWNIYDNYDQGYFKGPPIMGPSYGEFPILFPYLYISLGIHTLPVIWENKRFISFDGDQYMRSVHVMGFALGRDFVSFAMKVTCQFCQLSLKWLSERWRVLIINQHALDIQIPPEVRCLGYDFRVQSYLLRRCLDV